MASQHNSFGARSGFVAPDGRTLTAFRLDRLNLSGDIGRLPFSLKILLENLLRHEGGGAVTAADVEALTRWDAAAEPSQEISFAPARILLQDFTNSYRRRNVAPREGLGRLEATRFRFSG